MLNGTAACKTDACPPERETCPFYRAETGNCRAAGPGFRIEWRRNRNFCSSEDHDACTLFLGKILRTSLPQARLETLPFNLK